MKKVLHRILIASLFLFASQSFAKGKATKEDKAGANPTRETRERAARKACLEGDPTLGVSILSELFLDFGDASYIFNQGRCYEQSERYPEAIARFREYVRTGAAEADKARQHISECESLQAKKTPPSVAPVVPEIGAPTGQGPVSTPAGTETNSSVPKSADSGSGLRLAGLITAGIGVAGVVTGVVLNVKANSVAKEIKPPHAYDASKESTRKSYETYSWVGYGVGAAAIVTGAVLYVVGLNKDDSVAFAPIYGPGLAGATFCRSF